MQCLSMILGIKCNSSECLSKPAVSQLMNALCKELSVTVKKMAVSTLVVKNGQLRLEEGES